jgi:hypothetical protein
MGNILLTDVQEWLMNIKSIADTMLREATSLSIERVTNNRQPGKSNSRDEHRMANSDHFIAGILQGLIDGRCRPIAREATNPFGGNSRIRRFTLAVVKYR